MIFHDFILAILGDRAKIKALKILLKQPLGITGRALAKLIGVSHSKTNRMLKELVAQGVVRLHGQGKAHIYQVNKEHFLIEKINPIMALEADIFTILGEQLYSSLDRKPISIILFGSVAKGDERPDSDIDALFIFEDEVYHEQMAEEILEKCYNISSKYGNLLAVVAYPLSKFVKDMKEKEPLIREIIKHGKAIHGMMIIELTEYGGTKYKNG